MTKMEIKDGAQMACLSRLRSNLRSGKLKKHFKRRVGRLQRNTHYKAERWKRSLGLSQGAVRALFDYRTANAITGMD